MVIRTEYRGQRYSMGNSDPLPAGFEIRFGSLNFQATGNGYFMCITNRDELRARRQTGPARSPSHLPLGHQRPPARMLRAPQRLDAIDASVSALDRREWSADGPRASPRSATHPPARRQPLQGGALGFRTAVPPRPARCYDGIHRLRQHRRGGAQGSPWPPCSGQGPQRLRRRRVVLRLRQRAATRHFARVRGVGLLQRA
jgi:hypothetical protein